ncbi:DoxX family protein [Haladaptatus salinisoli]|uniref:DoxX family protein n=1 Tax=Haladaptatus salinisoli TaxID=2884876 RepID=UPI001D0A4821|nr:DoxX family protein [Haladaptatus salinisoli]
MALETTAGGLAFLMGRLVFGVLLGFMGLNHFTSLDGMSGYATAKGVPAPRLAIIVSGLMLILGGLAIALGVYPLVGAVVIALFFLGVTPVMHDFWTVDDPEQRQSEMTDFLKNATLFGAALVLVAISRTTWPYALNIGL